MRFARAEIINLLLVLKWLYFVLKPLNNGHFCMSRVVSVTLQTARFRGRGSVCKMGREYPIISMKFIHPTNLQPLRTPLNVAGKALLEMAIEPTFNRNDGIFLKWLLLFFAPFFGWGQSVNAPLNEDYYHWIDRYEIKTGAIQPGLFTSVKPYKRDAIVSWFDSLSRKEGIFSSRSDQFNRTYIQNDSWEWSRSELNTSSKPVLKRLFQKKSDLAFVDKPEFDLHVNPVLLVGVGSDSRRNEPLYVNTRGVELRGMVDRKIGFYSFLSENQTLLPQYVTDEQRATGVVPHEGFWKVFKNNGVDFFQARAYIDFNVSKHIYMQFGHDRMFIGNGHRSLIFSDYSPPNLFFRTNVKVWKLNYLFQLNRMAADYGGRDRYPQKFVAFHHLSLNIGKKFNLGVFESVIFSPDDPLNDGTFDLAYLNPVIFYRAIEQQFGSTDNVILGADFKWNAIKNVSVYGQVVIDEFLLDNVRAANGWWANKFGGQLGVKYIDAAGISNLDLQVELNAVRPFTYTHNTLYGNYSNYRQAIAHPLGANFRELVFIARYQPVPKLNLIAKTFAATIGRDGANENWGSNILKNYTTRQQDFDNTLGQGVKNDILFFDFTASYMIKHNVFIDVKQVIRNSSSANPINNTNSSITSLALRWNIAQRLYEF